MINKILIVKTSSLGDIIQSLPVLDELKANFPNIEIDWVVEDMHQNLLSFHPLIDLVVTFNRHHLIKFAKKLRRKKYDVVLDLQGNTKSALITFLAKARKKVGFGRKSVTEFLNLLVTTHKYNVSKKMNIQNYYLELVRKHFNTQPLLDRKSLNLAINQNDLPKELKLDSHQLKVMVAMNSARKNKELDDTTLISFLQKFNSQYRVHLYFVYGSRHEEEKCGYLKNQIGENCTVLGKMSIPVWQNVMDKMDLIFTIDTSALYLGGTTSTVTFSIFGPTDSRVFRPPGKHFSAQGTCPYKVKYVKQCPYLRNCQTSACIKKISLEKLWNEFQQCLIEINARNFLNY